MQAAPERRLDRLLYRAASLIRAETVTRSSQLCCDDVKTQESDILNALILKVLKRLRLKGLRTSMIGELLGQLVVFI